MGPEVLTHITYHPIRITKSPKGNIDKDVVHVQLQESNRVYCGFPAFYIAKYIQPHGKGLTHITRK